MVPVLVLMRSYIYSTSKKAPISAFRLPLKQTTFINKTIEAIVISSYRSF